MFVHATIFSIINYAWMRRIIFFDRLIYDITRLEN
jgi:hypothetical protein